MLERGGQETQLVALAGRGLECVTVREGESDGGDRRVGGGVEESAEEEEQETESEHHGIGMLFVEVGKKIGTDTVWSRYQ